MHTEFWSESILGKHPHRTPRKWKDNITKGLEEIGCEDGSWN